MTRINITDHAVTRFRRRFPDYVVPGVNARKQLARLVPLATECKPYLIDTALFAELVEKYGENFPTYLRYKDMYMIFVKNTMVTVYSVIKPDPKDDNSNENHRKLRTKRHTAKS
jgi:hypothetical protein